MNGTVFCIKDAAKAFPGGRHGRPVTALSGLTLDVREGEFLSVIGPTGCGKTTLLYLLAGFLKPDSGSVLYRGVPVPGPAPERAVIFQDYGLFPWKTVAGNIAFPALARGESAAQARAGAVDLARKVHLAGFEDKYPHQLSGGMKQRVGIARALACNPDVVLMDEPFAALDNITRELLQEEILRLGSGAGRTFVLVTHHLEEAIFMSRRIVVMAARPGRVKEIVAVDLPWPRSAEVKTTQAFLALKARLTLSLREEVEKSLALGQEQELVKEMGVIRSRESGK